MYARSIASGNCFRDVSELSTRALGKRTRDCKIVRFVLLLGASSCLATMTFGRSANSELRYKFPLGQTNVYHVEVQVRGETGLETTGGNVFLVPSETGSNVVRLSYRANLDVKREADNPYRGFGGMFPGRMAVQPSEKCEIQIDDRGRVLRDAGDYPLPIPFGVLMTALIEPLPESPSATKWETSGESAVVDSPYWLGPAAGIFPQQFGPPFYMNYGPRISTGVLPVTQHVIYRVTATTSETITIHKQQTLHSLLKNGTDPRVSATVEGDLVFDRAAGLFRQIEMRGTALASTETMSRNTRVSLKCQLLQDAELAAALAPPVPTPTPKPAPDDLQKLVTDLASEDVTVRRNAAIRLGNTTLDSPSSELLGRMASLTTDVDPSIRQSAANFLKTYGTTNEVPVLIKLLKDSDWSIHQNAIKGLGRIKDERAIDPLVDEITRGGQPGMQEASTALASIGGPAETAVLQMLQEKYVGTKREACGILQRIGTSKSIGPLQEVVGDPDQMLSQAAVEAIRAIKLRQ
jgi:hypothetical protein